MPSALPGDGARRPLSPPTSAPLPPSDDASAWGHYYDFELTWRVHLSWLVLGHWSMLWRILARRPKRILEVGAGTGSHSIFLSYFCSNLVSVDISEDVLRRAHANNARFHGRVDYRLGDAFDLHEFRDGEFDVVYSQGFFEHFDDASIERLVGEQLRVGRRVFVSVPNACYGRQDFGNERLMTREEWDGLFRRLRFKVAGSRDYGPSNRLLPQPKIHYLGILAA